MRLIWNKYLPPKGFLAITILHWILLREEYRNRLTASRLQQTVRHESIHEQQWLDFTPSWFPDWLRCIIGGVLFYTTYVIEWLIKCIISLFTLGKVKAYMSISYEQEAYKNQDNLSYLKERKHFSWLKYIFKVVY